MGLVKAILFIGTENLSSLVTIGKLSRGIIASAWDVGNLCTDDLSFTIKTPPFFTPGWLGLICGLKFVKS